MAKRKSVQISQKKFKKGKLGKKLEARKTKALYSGGLMKTRPL